MARAIVGAERFMEVHVSTPLEVCEERDPKGLYDKARAGVIPHFTGVSAPYEAPAAPDLTLNTAGISLESATQQVLNLLIKRGFMPVP